MFWVSTRLSRCLDGTEGGGGAKVRVELLVPESSSSPVHIIRGAVQHDVFFSLIGDNDQIDFEQPQPIPILNCKNQKEKMNGPYF